MHLLELLSKIIPQKMALPLGIGCHKQRKDKLNSLRSDSPLTRAQDPNLSKKTSVSLNNQEHLLISV